MVKAPRKSRLPATAATNKNDPDLYGITLLDARWRLLPQELFANALLAYERWAKFNAPYSKADSNWRYETFALPNGRLKPAWEASYPDIPDNIFAREVKRQDIWLEHSLLLCARLEAGHMQGFGRRNDIAGDWLKIPPSAWRLLRIPFDPEFTNWRLGHASGGGLKLWDIRILDKVGLPLRSAAIAYGSRVKAAIVLRAKALETLGYQDIIVGQPHMQPFGGLVPPPRQMIAVLQPDTGDNCDALTIDVAAAENALREALLFHLASGALRGFGRRPDGQISAISRSDWLSGEPDLETSSLCIGRTRYTNVLVKPLDPDAEQVDPDVGGRQWAQEDLGAWWEERVAANPESRWPFSMEDDWSAAREKFPGVGRKAIRALRESLGVRAKAGRRKEE